MSLKTTEIRSGESIEVTRGGFLTDYIPSALRNALGIEDTVSLPFWLLKRSNPQALFEYAKSLGKNEIQIIQVKKETSLLLVDGNIYQLNGMSPPLNFFSKNKIAFNVEKIDESNPYQLKYYFDGFSFVEAGTSVLDTGVGLFAVAPLSLIKTPSYKGYKLSYDPHRIDEIKSKIESGRLKATDFLDPNDARLDKFKGARERLLSGAITAAEAFAIYLLITAKPNQEAEAEDDEKNQQAK